MWLRKMPLKGISSSELALPAGADLLDASTAGAPSSDAGGVRSGEAAGGRQPDESSAVAAIPNGQANLRNGTEAWVERTTAE